MDLSIWAATGRLIIGKILQACRDLWVPLGGPGGPDTVRDHHLLILRSKVIVTTSTTLYPQNEDEAEDGDVLLGHVVD